MLDFGALSSRELTPETKTNLISSNWGKKQTTADYTSNLQSAFQKFTTQASQTGSSTFDMQKINDQTNQIMKELQKLVNPNGFNFEQTMSTYMNLVRMQTSLLTSFFNTSGGLAMGRAYMELMSTMMTVNSGFAMDMATACVPQLRANYKGPSN